MTEILRTSEMAPGGVWDGAVIKRTKNCEGCEYFIKVIDDLVDSTVPEDACGWGVAWKRLTDAKKPRKCGKLGKVNMRTAYLRSLGIKI